MVEKKYACLKLLVEKITFSLPSISKPDLEFPYFHPYLCNLLSEAGKFFIITYQERQRVMAL
jgi:hypothetical protein